MHTESSWKSRAVLLHFKQLRLWFLEHFSDGKSSLNNPASPPSFGHWCPPHLSLSVVCQRQLFMQLRGEVSQGADLGGDKRNLK